MTVFRCAIYAILVVIGSTLLGNAEERPHPVCEMVGPRQLAALSPSPLYPMQQENGCRWSKATNGKAYFQIGIIESQRNLRQFFEKTIPAPYQLKRISDLGERGLYTECKGYLSVIAIREGNWVLISTVDLLYIKHGDARQSMLWDIYREILRSVQ